MTVLQATDVTVTVDGGKKLVRGASLTIAPGETVGLIGPNGAGKSTLVKALCGLMSRSEGDVSLDGQPMAAITRREVARRIAYLAQGNAVYWPISVFDAVMLGRDPHRRGLGRPSAYDRDVVMRVLDACDVAHLCGRTLDTLSGGEGARVFLARALAVEAPLLFADEPVAALDPAHQLRVMEVFRKTAQDGAGVVIVMHDLALAAFYCDRLVLMHEGRIRADGTPQDVITREKLAEVYAIGPVSADARNIVPDYPWVLSEHGVTPGQSNGVAS